MASLNGAQIRGRAKEILGRDISEQEVANIMNATSGGDPAIVDAYLRGQTPASSGDFTGTFARMAGAPTAIPPIKLMPLSDYEKLALEELRPYYERILKEEGGDVERAKRRLDEDYQRGVRVAREDTNIQRKQLTDVTIPQEKQNLQESLIKRGLMNTETVNGMATGGVPSQLQNKLADDQRRRQEAIERALSRYEDTEGIRKGRAFEDIGTEWDRRQFALGEEKKQRAVTMGRMKREDEYSQQQLDREAKLQQVNNIYG